MNNPHSNFSRLNVLGRPKLFAHKYTFRNIESLYVTIFVRHQAITRCITRLRCCKRSLEIGDTIKSNRIVVSSREDYSVGR